MASVSRVKPVKPYPDFPLFAHATHRWAKKILGKTHYFGPWEDADAALQLYLYQRDDLYAGRTPRRPEDAGIQLRELCNRFLTHKYGLMSTGQITRRSIGDYERTAKKLIVVLGAACHISAIQPTDLDPVRMVFSRGRGAISAGNDIRRTRTIFKWAYEQGLIPHPMRFGEFRQPGAKVRRQARVLAGRKDFTQPELRTLLDNCEGQMRAMILLGINCGFGNKDCSDLTAEHLDLDRAQHNFPRQKTYIERLCPLWPETVLALRVVAAVRSPPRNPEHANRVFVSPRGGLWVRESTEGVPTNLVALTFARLKKKCSIDRPRVGFYGLRRTCQTVGGGKDEVAVKSIMGHADEASDMSAVYRQGVALDRLQAVTDHVHAWLFPAG